MKVVVLSSQKGGVGKTTLAVNLACQAAAVPGNRVVVLELDPQGSAGLWARQRALIVRSSALAGQSIKPSDSSDGLRRVPVLACKRDAIKTTLQAQRDAGVTHVFVDCPPASKKWQDALFQLADLILLPVRPGFFDMISGFKTWKQVDARPVRWVINGAFDHVASADSVARIVQGELNRTMQCTETIVAQSAEWVMSAGAGLSVCEYAPQSAAAAQLAALWKEVDAFPEIMVKHRYG